MKSRWILAAVTVLVVATAGLLWTCFARSGAGATEGLQMTLVVCSEEEQATFTVTVVNPGRDTRRLRFNTGQQFDIFVYQDQTLVWQWSSDRLFTQALTEATLQPGGELVFTGSWDGAAPGSYVARAALLETSGHVEIERDFEIR